MERNIKNSPDYNPDRPVYETIGDPDTDLGIFMNGLKFSSQSVEQSGSAAELLNPDDYAPAEFNGSIDRSWAITSYSNLMGRGIRKTRKYSLQTEQPGHNDENDAARNRSNQVRQEQCPQNVRLMQQALQHKADAANAHHQESWHGYATGIASANCMNGLRQIA